MFFTWLRGDGGPEIVIFEREVPPFGDSPYRRFAYPAGYGGREEEGGGGGGRGPLTVCESSGAR